MTFVARLLVSTSLMLACTGAFAAERGYFGFSPDASTSGFLLNPTVNRVVIAKVLPGSPAARAGMVAGDEVLKVEDMKVPGSKGLTLRGMIQRDVGQTLHATLKHVDGTVYSVSMVAAAHVQ